MRKAEWGWRETNRGNTNTYRIASVLVFPRCAAPLISHQGRPWRLQESHESRVFEKLLADAGSMQVERLPPPSPAKKSRRPNNSGAARDQERHHKKRKQAVQKAYVLHFGKDRCCRRRCTELWRTEAEGALVVRWVRAAYQSLSRERQREFIHNRMEEFFVEDGVKKRLFLEKLSDMKARVGNQQT